ncbi:hypothetical protein ADK93_12780 [Streptomyces sp. XY58]|nr:hypothetical protein ADK93_12780 [Streptomyces sp. XY58]KOV12934.1 hypothetical protein ADK89_01850 [Streptomyces sp. XY37]KOV56512.1 hypothetical protein ADK99_00220 [Streptomyces sp. MMG1064]
MPLSLTTPYRVVAAEKELDQIAATEDADHAAFLVDDRQPLDPVPLHDPGRADHAPLGSGRDGRAPHQLLGCCGTAGAPPAEKVCFGDDADRVPDLVDDGHGGDVELLQEPGDLLERGRAPDGDGGARHQLRDTAVPHGGRALMRIRER